MFKTQVIRLRSPAARLLGSGLALIVTVLCCAVLRLGELDSYDAARLSVYIYAQLEHVAMATAAIVVGALTLDLAAREKA